VLRYALIANPYTQPMNFTFDALTQASTSIERLQSRVDRLRERAAAANTGDASASVNEWLRAATRGFDAALDNNLNVPQALAEVFGLVAKLNQSDASLSAADARAALETFSEFDAVLDVLARKARSGLVPFAELDPNAAISADPGALPAADELDDTAIAAALSQRHAAKRAKRYADADAIRRALSERGITIEDAPQGVRWKR
jgi:cysteinyl-tRNA synthetase